MPSIVKTLLICLTIFVTIAPASRAGVISLSVETTASQSGYGYTIGESYSFILNLTGNFQSSNSIYSASFMEWLDSGADTTRLWSSFEGSFANGGGTYTATSPSSYFDIMASGFEFTVDSFTDSDIGVETPDGTVISMIYALLTSSSYTPSSVAITPENYFPGFPSPSFGSSTLEFTMDGGQTISFNVTEVSVSTVPEPTTWALVCLSIFGITIFRRKLINP